MKKTTHIFSFLFFYVCIFVIVSLLFIISPKKASGTDDYLKNNFSKEEIEFINDSQIPLEKLKEYKKYSNFDIYNYYNYEKNFNGNYLVTINITNNPYYYKAYENVQKALFIDKPYVLINKAYTASKDYVPKLEKVSSYNINYIKRENEEMMGNKEALESLEKMFEKAKNDGFDLTLFSAYRPYEKQYDLYYNVNKENDEVSARPGHSEHQSGLAFDISTLDYGLTEYFAFSKEYQWLKNNARSFGFILRFPENKEEFTLYSFEPWHYRFVGDEALKIADNQTLEEYILENFEI